MATIQQLAAVLLVLCFAMMVGAQEAILDLSSRNQNFITLRCRDTSSFLEITNADFWITNPSIILESALDAAGITHSRPGEGLFEFQLSPSLEGEYFCGVIADSKFSNSLELVVFPEESEVRAYYAVETGQPVSLQCPFRPGNLIEFYEYSWRIGANTLVDARYTVTTDGNLNITATQPSDTNPFYQCQVRINDPITGSPRPLRISGPIELVVYEQATIVGSPMDTVLAADEASMAEFTCRVKGSPLPDVTWKHNGQDITQLDDSKFQSSTEDINTDAFTSKLTINQITGEDSGIITCTAENSVVAGEMGGIQRYTDSSQVTFSVLSDDFTLRITVTTEGVVQYRVTLLAAVPEPVRLMIRYLDTTTERSAQSVTDEAFTDTTQIFYEDDSAPYQQFRVQVALMVNNIIGPAIPSNLEESDIIIDLSKPQNVTITSNDPSNNSDNSTLTIALAVGVPSGVVLLIVVIFVLSMWYRQSKRRQNKLSFNKEQDKIKEEHLAEARKESDPEIKRYHLEAAKIAEEKRVVPDISELDSEEDEKATSNSASVAQPFPPLPGTPV